MWWAEELLLSGAVVVQLVKALRYKSESGGFDSQLGNWNISDLILPWGRINL
jgi:hypothetical protein